MVILFTVCDLLLRSNRLMEASLCRIVDQLVKRVQMRLFNPTLSGHSNRSNACCRFHPIKSHPRFHTTVRDPAKNETSCPVIHDPDRTCLLSHVSSGPGFGALFATRLQLPVHQKDHPRTTSKLRPRMISRKSNVAFSRASFCNPSLSTNQSQAPFTSFC